MSADVFTEELATVKAPAKRKRKPMPSVEALVAAHPIVLASLPNVTIETALTSCWACGAEGGPLYSAHVLAFSRGGDEHPSNLIRLCALCHEDQPDALDLMTQLLWLVTRPTYDVLIDRILQDVMPAIRMVFRERGVSPEVQRAWLDEALRDVKSPPVPTTTMINARANVRWSRVQRIVEWLEARGA